MSNFPILKKCQWDIYEKISKKLIYLYADYKPKTTYTALKDAIVAKHTLKLIKDRDLSYPKKSSSNNVK